jgi:6-pyruvoyltetrahydropterin/6-carboxytetrahydropterin synthase
MYRLAVKTDFIAQHFLIGGDWGAENKKHSHHYQFEIELAGEKLDGHGYLVDIVKVKDYLETLIAHYRDKTLNDLTEFKGLNPSIENLACISHRSLSQHMHDIGMPAIIVKVWEDDIASVSYQTE